MKKIATLLLLSIGTSLAVFAQKPFTQGNLVAYRVGDGNTTLRSVATAVFLDEYSPSGDTLVQSIKLPKLAADTIGTSNRRVTSSGTATSEGLLTLSTNGLYLLATGYNADTGTTSISSTTSAAVSRVVATVDANATINSTTSLSNVYSGNNIRGACSTDGTNIWASGATSGTTYTTLGSTTATVLSTSLTTTRCINVFNNQLYISSSSGAFLGVSAVGSGLPTASGQTTTILSGFPTSGTHSSYEFAMNSAGTIIYVADDGAGIQKWTLSSGTWSLAYVLNATTVRGLTVDWSGTNPVIYATTTATSANTIIAVTDAGSAGATPTTIATAGANTVFRGIAFAPKKSTLPLTLISFNGSYIGNGVKLWWSTVDEVNTKEFTIERSFDAKNYTDIATIPSYNLTTLNNYDYTDNTNLEGVIYYRLKMINTDGTYTYSNVITVNITVTAPVGLYPNPVINQLNLTYAKAGSSAKVFIVSIDGKIITAYPLQPSSTNTSLNVAGLIQGTYLLVLQDGNNKQTVSFVKE